MELISDYNFSPLFLIDLYSYSIMKISDVLL